MKKIYILFLILISTNLWAQEGLKNDKNLIRGKLENGFEYLIYKNKKPEKRVDLRLLVKSGSYYENSDEEGIAHFLEHMVFNGTTHFKPDELIKYFQTIGMSYGADANAYTSFFRTVYKIFLPQNRKEDIKQGLLVLYDYANEALLLKEEIEKEAKVVLAEKTDRDSIGYRQYTSYLKFFTQNGRVAERLPIGKEEDIKAFDNKALRTFYDNWYRPDNIVLVAVGDFDEKKVEALIKKRFENIKNRGNVPKEPQLTILNHKGIKPYYFFDNEEEEVRITIETAINKKESKDSYEKRVENIKEELARIIMQERFDIRKQDLSSPFSSATFYTSTYLKNIKNSAISATALPEKWEETLSEIEKALRRALKFGFTKEELERAKIKLIATLDNNAKKESGRDSREIAANIIEAAFNKTFFISPSYKYKLFNKTIKAIKLKEVERSFEKLFNYEHRLISLIGNSGHKYSDKEGVKKILEVYNNSKKINVGKIKRDREIKFPYIQPIYKKSVAIKKREVKELGIKVVTLPNNITLNLKKTNFKQNEVLFSLAFGKGVSKLPSDKDGLPFLSETMFKVNGFGKLQATTLNNLLQNNSTNIDLNIGHESFILKGKTSNDKLEFLFQLLYTYFLDHKYSEEDYRRTQKQIKEIYPSFLNSVEGIMRIKGDRLLANGDNRFGMPEKQSTIENISLEDFHNWYIKSLENDAFELSFIGDFDEKKVIDLTKKYFGNFHKRENSKKSKRDNPTFKNGVKTNFYLDTRIPKAIIRVSYPIKESLLNSKKEIDIKKIRRIGIVATVLYEFLRKEIREEMGVAYSPYSYFSYNYAYIDYSIINIEIKTEKESTSKLIKAIKRVVAKFKENGIGEEELMLVLNPLVVHIKDLKKDNRYWRSVLENSYQIPEKLEWSKTILEDYKSISSKEINTLAKKHLRNEEAHIIIVRP